MASYTMTLKQMMENNIKIFDFNYPFFNEEYRKQFEDNFIDYFLFEEIGLETPSQFKHRLKSKLNLIMPYYNKLYESQLLEQRILDNYDVTEEITRNVIGDVRRENNGTSSNKSNTTNKRMYKDTPKTRIDINNFDVLTNLTKTEDTLTNTSNNNGIENTLNNTNENYIRTMKGNIGVQTDADAIVKYWSSLRNVTLEIFENELSSLFMGIF